jgi:hypothetical protein
MSWVAAAIVTSSVIGSNAAKQAANTQANAANQAAQLQQQQFNITNEQQAPYRQSGYNALNTIGSLGSGTYGITDASGNAAGTGVGSGYLTKQYTPEDFAAGIDPGYQFRLQQGQEATNRMANMGGGLISGNALKGQEDYTQGLASQEYGNAFNRFQTQRSNIYNTLASIAGLGQTSLGQTTAAGTTAAGNIGANIANAGAAQAGGIVGSANAISGGLQQFGNQQYLSQLLAPKTGGVNYGLTSSGGGSVGYGGSQGTNLDYMNGGQGLSSGGSGIGLQLKT